MESSLPAQNNHVSRVEITAVFYFVHCLNDCHCNSVGNKEHHEKSLIWLVDRVLPQKRGRELETLPPGAGCLGHSPDFTAQAQPSLSWPRCG